MFSCHTHALLMRLGQVKLNVSSASPLPHACRQLRQPGCSWASGTGRERSSWDQPQLHRENFGCSSTICSCSQRKETSLLSPSTRNYRPSESGKLPRETLSFRLLKHHEVSLQRGHCLVHPLQLKGRETRFPTHHPQSDVNSPDK